MENSKEIIERLNELKRSTRDEKIKMSCSRVIRIAENPESKVRKEDKPDYLARDIYDIVFSELMRDKAKAESDFQKATKKLDIINELIELYDSI